MQVIGFGKKKRKRVEDQICHLGLIPAQRGGQGEKSAGLLLAKSAQDGLVAEACSLRGWCS